MNKPGNYEGYLAIVPKDTKWSNKVPARSAFHFLFYRPITKANKIECPILLIIGNNDNLVPPRAGIKMSRKKKLMGKIKLVQLPVGHFDVYVGETFEKVVEIEAEFLNKHLFA